MCAICGIFELNNGNVKDCEQTLGRMQEVLAHRGPDGSDSYIDEKVALGFNRLSFIDLTGGMQPIESEDQNVIMVCNGEIYNFKELREDLIARSHVFRTGTDVEVIIHLYEEYGTDFPDMLNGQFAIALYDKATGILFLARDHVGICPLYYTVFDNRLIFASEIKAILEYPGMPRKLNMKAVDQLMNYPGVISPVTFFEGVSSLRSGHMLKVTPEAGVEDIEYWDMRYPVEDPEDLGEDYYVDKFRELFKDAVSRRLVADVPIGFYISGGLDSSMVACYIGKYLLDSSYSFAAKVGDGDLDETRFQDMVKECVQSNHYVTHITEEEIWDKLYTVIYHAESAVKESYDVAAYKLSELAYNSPVKAVLTGQGSDEFFCGYAGYMLDQFRVMQRGSMTDEEKASNEILWGDPFFRYERIHPEIRKQHLKIYSDAMAERINEFSAISDSPIDLTKVKGLNDIRRRSYIDYKLRLSDHLLIEHGDHMVFSHSIEGRHPFLDIELLKFVATVPDKYKLNGTNEKYIVKRAGEGIVPSPILKRKKFPFQAQGMSALIKCGDPGEFLDEALIRDMGIFNADQVNELKRIYAQDDFKLMGAYEIDYLLIVMTVNMLCRRFGLSV